jgi:ABC-type multidrug transport system fused ATPase/permease subunit
MRAVFGIWTTLPRALPYLRPYRKYALLALVFTILGAAVALAEPWPLAILVDSVLGQRDAPGVSRWFFGDSPGQYELLVLVVLAGLLITLITHGTTVLADWVGARLEQEMVLDLRSDLFAHCQRLSLTFHDGRMTGQLMNQINIQASAMGVIILAFPPILQGLLTLVGMFIVTFLISWQIALITLVAVPFIWFSLGLYGKRIVPRLQRVQSLEWQSLSIVYEAMAMLRVIVAFGRQDHEFKRFRSQGEVAVEERVKLTVRQTLFSLAVTLATAFGTALVIGFGAWYAIRGKITVGELLVLIAYVAAIYQPLEQVSNTIGELNDQFVQFNSSLDLLDEEPEVTEVPDAIEMDRAQGRVTFENVTFAYKGREDTLRDISFTTEPGQRVAVVGPTGAGKTTLINLLIRYYDPHGGRISIDGIDIRELTLKSLREQVGVVLQEPLLFSGTIADNIRYGKLDGTMDEVVAAAKAANCHDFIERQPQGYETVLGERGEQLSGGERQRIAVARAFIKDAPILILDEPTSSIDSKTEDVILAALDDLMEGRTSFMIAHRLSTVRDADLILVVREGEIVEQGSHEELVALGGLYHGLHEAQTRQRRSKRERALDANGSRAEAPSPEAEPDASDFDKPEPKQSEADRVRKALQAGDFDAFSDTNPEPEPRDVELSEAQAARNVVPDEQPTPGEVLIRGMQQASETARELRRSTGRALRDRRRRGR